MPFSDTDELVYDTPKSSFSESDAPVEPPPQAIPADNQGGYLTEVARGLTQFVPAAIKTISTVGERQKFTPFGPTAREVADYALRKVGVEPAPGELPETRPIYKIGQRVEDVLNQAYPAVPEPERNLGHDVAAGLGQMASMLAGGVGARAAGATAKGAAGIATLLGGVQEFDDAFGRSRQRGDDPDTAFAKSLGYSTVAALIENHLGAGRILKKYFPDPAEAARKLSAWGVSKAVAGSLAVGFGEEGSQRFAQNWIVEGKPSLEGVVQEGAPGGIVQAIAELPATLLRTKGGRVRRPTQAQPTEETDATRTGIPIEAPGTQAPPVEEADRGIRVRDTAQNRMGAPAILAPPQAEAPVVATTPVAPLALPSVGESIEHPVVGQKFIVPRQLRLADAPVDTEVTVESVKRGPDTRGGSQTIEVRFSDGNTSGRNAGQQSDGTFVPVDDIVNQILSERKARPSPAPVAPAVVPPVVLPKIAPVVFKSLDPMNPSIGWFELTEPFTAPETGRTTAAGGRLNSNQIEQYGMSLEGPAKAAFEEAKKRTSVSNAPKEPSVAAGDQLTPVSEGTTPAAAPVNVPTPIANVPTPAPVAAKPAETLPQGKAWSVPWADGRARAWFKTKEAADEFYRQKLSENDVDGPPEIGEPTKGVKYADEKYQIPKAAKGSSESNIKADDLAGVLGEGAGGGAARTEGPIAISPTTPTVWKVSYTDLETRAAKRPFFKHVVYSEGATRQEAIDRVKSYHGNLSKWGEFRASKAEGKKADSFFRAPVEETPGPASDVSPKQSAQAEAGQSIVQTPSVAPVEQTVKLVADVGDEVTFTPSAKKGLAVSGIVQEIVNGGRGYNILSPLPNDPNRVVRVWLEDGRVEKKAAPDTASLLTVDVPFTDDARRRIKAVDLQQAQLRGEYQKIQDEIKSLEKTIKPQRGNAYSRSKIKASAKRLDVERFHALQKQARTIDEQLHALDESARVDRRLIDQSVSADVVNNPQKSLAQRLVHRVSLWQDQNPGARVPPELVKARDAELYRELKAVFPDATDAELLSMRDEAQRNAYFGDPITGSGIGPKLDIQTSRRAALDAAVNAPDIPKHLFSEAFRDKLNRYRTGDRPYGGKIDPNAPVEPLSATVLAELKADIQSETTRIREELAATEKKNAEEKAANEAQEAKLIRAAETEAASAKGIPAKQVKSELVSRIKKAIDDLVASDEITLTKNDEGTYAAQGKGGGFSFGEIEPAGSGRFKVTTWQPGDTKTKISAAVGSQAEAESIIKAMAAQGSGKVVIGVPGDGVFRLYKHGPSLLQVWSDARKIEVSSGGPNYRSVGGAEKPPSSIKTVADWNAAKEYHGLQASDEISTWSPALLEVAKKINPKNPETVNTAAVDKWIEKRRTEKSEGSASLTESTGAISEQSAQPIIAAWRKENPNAPEVQVVNRPEWTQTGSDGKQYGVRGWWDGQKIVINLAHVANADAVREVLNHELIHPLLDSAQGRAAIESAITQELGGDALAKIRQRYKQGATESDEQYQRRAMAEWFAQLKETTPTLWQRIVARIREFLSKLNVAGLSDDEIGRAILRNLESASEFQAQEAVGAASLGEESVPPWQMTQKDFAKKYYEANPEEREKAMRGIGVSAETLHRAAVRRAARAGIPIPEFNQRYLEGQASLTNEPVENEVRGSVIDPATGKWAEEAEPSGDIVQIAGIEYNILGKERLTPEQKAAADTRASDYVESLNLPGEADLSSGTQRGATDTNLVFKLESDGQNHDDAGEALLKHLTEQIQSQHQPGGDPAYVSSLVNFLNKNFNVGNLQGVFSDGMIQRLMEISVGESSWRGTMLRAITGITEDMGTVARNAKFFLRRTYENMFGGDLTRKIMDRIALNFRERFTGEEIERLYNENPKLQELFLGVVGRLKVKPSLRDVILEIFATPINKQDDIVERFVDTMVNKFSATPSEAARLKSEFSATFARSFAVAREKAQAKALATLLPEERKVIGPQTQLWKKLTDLVNSGWFDSAKVVEEYAKTKGMKVPTEAEIKQMRDWSIREQSLRKPTPEEVKLYGDKANILVEGTTLEKRQELLRQMNTQWSRWTHPVASLRHPSTFLDPVKRYNSAMAANEWLTANLLLKLGFGTRQVIDVATQMMLHTPTRAAQYAFEQWGNDKTAGRDSNLLNNLSQAMTDAYRTRLKVLGDTLASFKRTLAGKGEQKNVEQLISSIAVFDRALMKADEMKAAGKPAAARFLHLLALTMRFGRQFAAAADVIQGVPAEAQEMAHQIRTGLREQGKSPGQQEVEFNTILGLLTTARVESLAQARQILEDRGLDLNNASIQRAAWHILREKIYSMAKTAGLPADEWKIQNHYYRNVLGWNEPESQGFGAIGGPGGLVAMGAKGGKEVMSKTGLPAFPFVFGNAMGISLNRKLAYTPLGLFPGFFKGSPWFEGERNIRQRKIEAVIGTTIGSTLFTLAALGIWTVLPRKWPEDEKEKAKWTANGWQPNMLIIPVSDTQEMKISTRVGPMSLFSPYLAAGGAFHDATVEQAKKQEALNERAAKLGLTPEKLDGLDPSQWLNVIGSAAYSSAVGGRTTSGMLGSYTDFGQFSAKKAGAAAASTLVPGLPGFQEISRMAGSNINPKLASFWDLLVPLPTSDANRVNMLGDPMRNENDFERIFQVLSGGTAPLPADKEQFNKNRAYSNLFASDFRPPAINPSRGYQFGDELRSMTEAELQKYTTLRGKEFSDELGRLDLTGLSPEAAKKAAASAFQRAETRALSEVGAVAPRVSSARGTSLDGSSTAAGLSLPGSRSTRTRRYGLSSIRPIRLRGSRTRTRRISTRRSRVSLSSRPRGRRSSFRMARIRRPSISQFV